MAFLLASNDGFLPTDYQNARRRQLIRRKDNVRYDAPINQLPNQCLVEGSDDTAVVISQKNGIARIAQWGGYEQVNVPYEDISSVLIVQDGEMTLNNDHINAIIKNGELIGEDTKENLIYKYKNAMVYIPEYIIQMNPDRRPHEIIVKAKELGENGVTVRASFFTKR